MRKKILHFITGLELGGGAETMLLQLLPSMQEKLENRVCVVKGYGEIGRKLEEKEIKVYYLNFKNFFDLPKIILNYRKILRDFKPDIQVNYLIHADIFGRIFGKIFGVSKIIPYIRNIHKNKKLLLFLDKLTLPLANFILTNSTAAQKYYIEKLEAKEDKIKCIPNAIDLSKFENIMVDRDRKLEEIFSNQIVPTDVGTIVATIARMEKQKDILTLIKAFSRLSKKYPKTHLLLVGHGKEKEEMINLTKELELEKRVVFLEKRKDIAEILKITDIFVLSSLNEGMSNALLEAMASQKLIITSDIPENKELIEDKEEGLNFRVGDTKDLENKLTIAIENFGSLDNLRKNAFQKVKKKYDLSVIIKKFESFLLEI